MKKFLFILSFIFVCIFLIFLVYGTTQQIKNPDPKVLKQEIPSQPAVKPDINFGKIPLYFISNEGQVHKQAKFYAKASRYTLWLTNKGLVFDSTKRSEVRVKKSEESYKPFQRPNASTPQRQHQRDVSRLMFIGSNKNPEVVPLNETKLKVNYFKGNDPSKWVGNIPTSQAVLYKNLYKNIDLKVYGIEKQIEYDWIIKPGGNPEDIRFEYKDVKKTKIDKDGNLVITTEFGELIHKKPVSYQKIGDGKKQKIEVTFKKISKNVYGFEVGDYDKSKQLIIDPVVVLAYSTYLGGSDWETASGIAVDSSGYVYVTGHTLSTDYPKLNQYMSDLGDSALDVFITKLDPSQSGTSSLLYSTYLGGGSADEGKSIDVDSSGCAYVTGFTSSTNFPLLNQYMMDPGDSNDDLFVAKLDTTLSGTSSLLYSTYLGGGSGERGYGITVDSSGNVYVTGKTGSTDFPILNQYMSHPGDIWNNVFISKLDPSQSGASSLLYSTYLGGGGFDEGFSIAVDNSSNAYVTGFTSSTDFPILNQYMSDPGDSANDVFVTKLDTTQSGTSCLLYSTYLGGSENENGRGIAVDSSGYAYISGRTYSTDFPILNQYMSDPGDSAYDVFITKLDPSQSGTSSLLYSTYLGGGSDDKGLSIAIDNIGFTYVTGYTSSTNFPLLNQYMMDPGDSNDDLFVTKLDTTLSGTSSLLYSTYLGGASIDQGYSIAVDNLDNFYVTGYTLSTDFPCKNQYQADQPSGDGFIIKFSNAFPQNPAVLTAPISSLTSASCTTGGDVFWEGDSAVTARGVCLSLSPNPTIWDNYTTDGSGTGVFVSSLTGLTPETIYYVKAYAANDHGLDYGEEIQFTTLPISITVTSPNGGESWCTGFDQNITWIPDGVTNTLYIILQQNDVNVALIEKNINPSLGTYAWTVGDCRLGTVVAGVNYKILIRENGTTIKDKSDAVFTIFDPSVRVTSPNGGENWQMRDTVDITWDSEGVTNTLYIILQQNGVNVALIAKNINQALETYSWTVGDCRIGTVVAGSNYKILIKEKDSTVKDKSNGVFDISN